MKAHVVVRIAFAVAFSAGFPLEVRSASDTEKIAREPVQSSTISSAGYSRKSRMLDIEFRTGAVYRYQDVPASVYAAFTAAQSKGRYFGAEIRGKYVFEKMKVASE